MTKYGAVEDFNEWEDYGDAYVYSFYVSEFYDDDDSEKDSNNMKKHVMLEFLNYLDVIEYERGYDGLYYDIVIRKK